MERETTLKRKIRVIAVSVLAATAVPITRAEQSEGHSSAFSPIVPAWHVQALLKWHPQADPAAPYNVSHVPLKRRIRVPAALQANGNARSGQGRIQSLDTYNRHTSKNPAQGGAGTRYAFTYWQYIHEAVYWGGSAGEGIIVPPSGEIVDCAHRNGVPMLGTVFFPPEVYGGNYTWVKEFIQKEDGRFPVADKLIEVAEYFRFDGWFINQETEGGAVADAAALRDMLKYIRDHSDLRMIWYDSMTESGEIRWQDQFNDRNDWYLRHNYSNGEQDAQGQLLATSIFLDFVVSPVTAPRSRQHALSLGLNPYDIHAGFELQANNFKETTSRRANVQTVFPPGKDHILSAGLYVPGQHARSLPDQDLLWSGGLGDPRDTSATVQTGFWRGFAHNMAAESSITSVPFMTNFCLGLGTDFYIKGKKVSEGQWWNRSLQDVLPTWRWIVDSKGSKLKLQLIQSDGFTGGGCLQVSGTLDADNVVRLYLTDLSISDDTRLNVVFKRGRPGDSQIQVGIALADDPTHFIYYDAGANRGIGWESHSMTIGEHAGKRIAAIALKFSAEPVIADYNIKIGQLGVVNGDDVPPSAPAEVRIVAGRLGEAALNIAWNPSSGEVAYYNIYSELGDGTMIYAGSTPNHYYYTERAHPDAVGLVVIAIGADRSHSPPGRTRSR